MHGSVPGATRQSDYRESLIVSILGKPFLIYGATVCQLCGGVQPFHGWATAVSTHRGREYVCVDCLREPSGEQARDRLRQTKNRFCEVCMRCVPPRPTVGDGLYLCRSCSARVDEALGEQTVVAFLRGLSRRRNLERRATAALEALDHNSEVARLTQEAGQRERAELDRQARAVLERRHARRGG